MKPKHLAACLLLAVLVNIIPCRLFAADAHDTTPEQEESTVDFGFDAGIKGYLVTGESPANFYLKPFADMSVMWKNLTFKPGYARYQHYQVSDALGGFYTIDFNQGGMSADMDITDELNISAAYAYSFGELDYSAHDMSGMVTFYRGKFMVCGALDLARKEFDVTAGNIKTMTYNFSADTGYDVLETLSIGAGYSLNASTYKNVDYTYMASIFRLNMNATPVKQVFLTAGLSAGFDNDSYSITGFDCGMSVKLYGMVKISLNDAVRYSIAPSSYGGSTSRKNGTGNGYGSARKTNPNLKSSLVGKSYLANNLNFGLSLML